MDKMAAISQATFSNAFSWMKICEFRLKFLFVPMCPTDNKWALFQVMAWRWSGDKPLSEPMLTLFTDSYMLHFGRWIDMMLLKRFVVPPIFWYSYMLGDILIRDPSSVIMYSLPTYFQKIYIYNISYFKHTSRVMLKVSNAAHMSGIALLILRLQFLL